MGVGVYVYARLIGERVEPTLPVPVILQRCENLFRRFVHSFSLLLLLFLFFHFLHSLAVGSLGDSGNLRLWIIFNSYMSCFIPLRFCDLFILCETKAESKAKQAMQ